MIDLSDPTLNRKKRQKLVKELYQQINKEVDELANKRTASSPLAIYWKTPQKKQDKIILETLAEKSQTRRLEIAEVIVKRPDYYENLYQEHLEKLLKSDKAFVRGIPKSADNRNEAISWIKSLLSGLSLDGRIKWLRKIIDLELFSEEILTKFRLTLYSMSDDLKTDKGRELTELCIQNKYKTISDLLDNEIEKMSQFEGQDLNRHIMQNELKELRRLLDIGDPFYVYRGFLVDEDEYVRLGKKSEGDAYWKQDAGIGISYSLDRNIAGYFCFWNLTHTPDGIDIPRKYRQSDLIPPILQNKEEFIQDQSNYISDIREGKIETNDRGVNKKPIICKYLIDPDKLKGFSMITSEAEVMLKPEDTLVESYEICTSRTLATCLWEWRRKVMKDWEDAKTFLTFNEDGIVVLPLINDEDDGMQLVFAEGKQLKDKITLVKDWIKEEDLVIKNELMEKIRYDNETARTSSNVWDIAKDYFLQYAINIPQEELYIDPLLYTTTMYNLMTNKYNINYQSRRGRIYTWTGTAIRGLKSLVTNLY